MRIGLLGASAIAPNAVIKPAAKRDDITVTAVAARDPDRARGYTVDHGIPAVSVDYAALVARDDVDLVYCALPPAAHVDAVRLALDAGKPVLLEKPFAMDADDARTIAAMADEAGLPVIEAFHYRFHPLFQHAIDLVADGTIGPVSSAIATFNVAIADRPDQLRWDPRLGGGAMMDLGCYGVHALRSLLQGEPDVVAAHGEFRRGVDARLSAALDFRGVPATVNCSMTSGPECWLELSGRDGSIHFRHFVAPHHGGEIVIETAASRRVKVAATEPTTYDAQLDHIVRVLRGDATPVTGGVDAIANMVAIDACRAMARG
ncbi:MAG: Gfo/Idh/MocA family oxidoreductase [Sphingomonas sp.]|uniref:Gfo/Idh/MocA family protein n=1 Tax=Sphingomonas sp. TaxID=28214 RepID=UPI001AC09A81|nr:Gfo/Idh/MocA family oxidoreductase [Sphingomonas sp.]MBN8807105.1 Gfo/Idh/MocA family oxidoreductase [Sphingomonas sp.]